MTELYLNFLTQNDLTLDSFGLTANVDPIKSHLQRKTVQEILEVFKQFKNSGDTELVQYVTTCGSDVCSNFKTSKFYCFVGNNSKNYCLVKISGHNGSPDTIKFCASIIKPKGVELNQILEPEEEDLDGLPF